MLTRPAWIQSPSSSVGEATALEQGEGPRGPAPIAFLTTDRSFAGTIERLLVRNGYRVSVAGSVSGLKPSDGPVPELALIDRRLDLIEQFRSQAQLRRVPSIAIIPAEHHRSEEDSIRDLERGYDLVFCSDRYRELIAHIRAMSRRHRSEHQPTSILRAGPLVMDPARYEITVGEAVKAVTNKEFEVLRQLLLAAGHVLSRQDLLDRVWGEDYALEEHALDVHIHSLRRKIEPDPSKPRLILTVRGVGYKVQAD